MNKLIEPLSYSHTISFIFIYKAISNKGSHLGFQIVKALANQWINLDLVVILDWYQKHTSQYQIQPIFCFIVVDAHLQPCLLRNSRNDELIHIHWSQMQVSFSYFSTLEYMYSTKHDMSYIWKSLT